MRFLIVLSLWGIVGQSSAQNKLYYNKISQEFLLAAIVDEDTKKHREELAKVPVDTLVKYLDSDDKRLAFWVNVYNAYIQYILRMDQSVYDDKSKFFGSRQIPLLGQKISFDRIEHGIIRRSQWKYGFGNVGKMFPPGFEKKLRLETREPRVHFVLNCGAKSCPTTIVLKPESIEKQLENSTKTFLKKTSSYDAAKNEVSVTSLFFWFRGDFGNMRGIRKFLSTNGIIPAGVKPKVEKTKYDWTIDLDNYILDQK